MYCKIIFCEFGRENCNKNVAVFLRRSKNLKKNIAIFSSLIRPLTTTADLQKILLQFNNLRRLRYQNETSNWFYWCEETVNYFSVCTKTTCLFKSRLPKSKTQNFVQKFLAKLHLKKAQVIQMLCDWLYSRQLKSKSV